MLFALFFWLCTRARRSYVRLRPHTAGQRRRCTVISVLVAVAFIFALWSTPILPQSKLLAERLGLQCDEERAINFLDQLCSNYTHGYIVGPLCPALCQPTLVPDDHAIRRLTIKKCLSHGNKVVLAMTLTRRLQLANGEGGSEQRAGEVSEDVVLKASHFSGEHYRSTIDGPLGGISMAEALELFKDLMDAFVSPYRTNSTALLKFMDRYGLAPPSSTPPLPPPSTAQLHSLWSLLDQEEFVHLMLLANSGVTPNLIGSCGHAYLVPSRPPPSAFNLMLLPHISWRERVRTALGFLTLEQRLASTRYGVFHLCDVKGENFGVRRQATTCSDNSENVHALSSHDTEWADDPGVRMERNTDESSECRNELEVEAIDIDISFFERKMKEMLGQPRCDTDEECEFFDCHAYCDKWRRQCADVRSNHNLHVLCRKIFIGTKTQVGLLWSAPVRIRHNLHLLLTECSDYTATTDTRLMTERLRTLLLEELNPRKRTQRQKAL
ncbi:divergent protein kinase domain 1C-like [Sycon ciliatum]|uniref:divergent protein kinase domain 1C-like n=1 Tax=Sycon ciliatum TaxID=27933 RepID=UPI0031F6315A